MNKRLQEICLNHFPVIPDVVCHPVIKFGMGEFANGTGASLG